MSLSSTKYARADHQIHNRNKFVLSYVDYNNLDVNFISVNSKRSRIELNLAQTIHDLLPNSVPKSSDLKH